MTASLTLHSGAHAATRADVLGVATPDATESWQPVPHGFLIDEVMTRLGGMGLQVQREQHGLSRDGQRWFGVFDLAARAVDKDYSLAVGIRNSHDMSFAAALLMGSRVWICDNLALSGEVQIVRKHTSRILEDLPGVLDGAMVSLSKIETFQAVRIEHYKNAVLTDKDAHDFMVRAVMAKVLPVTRLPLVANEWRKPRHEEFAPRTAWSLFNGFTEILKGTSMFALPRRTERLHLLLDRTVGVPKFEPQGEDRTRIGGTVLGDLRALNADDAEAIARAEAAPGN